MTEALASFTQEQYQFIGVAAVTGLIPFLGFVWRAAKWHSKIEYDIKSLALKIGTEKALAMPEEEKCEILARQERERKKVREREARRKK